MNNKIWGQCCGDNNDQRRGIMTYLAADLLCSKVGCAYYCGSQFDCSSELFNTVRQVTVNCELTMEFSSAGRPNLD